MQNLFLVDSLRGYVLQDEGRMHCIYMALAGNIPFCFAARAQRDSGHTWEETAVRS